MTIVLCPKGESIIAEILKKEVVGKGTEEVFIGFKGPAANRQNAAAVSACIDVA